MSEPDAAAVEQQEDFDFFISRRGTDNDIAVALKVDRVLREAGYKTFLQDKDFRNETFMSCMERGFAGIDKEARLIALLSPEYVESDHCKAEYHYPLTDDPLNKKQRLIVLRIADHDPTGFLKAIPYIDMVPMLNDLPCFREEVLTAVGHKEKAQSRGSAVPGQYFHPDIKPTPNFTGRDDELAELEKILWDGGQAAITQPAAVHGLGGVGKSILAREYAWQNKERYAGIWWLNAEQESGIIDGLIELGAKFIPGLKEAEEREAAAKATLDLLASHYKDAEKPWLLIFDNIENEESYRVHAPKDGAHVLVTSRASLFSKDFGSVPVDTWLLTDAITYLRDESGREFTDDQAQELAEALGCLPLALSHAAMFLKYKRAFRVEDYLANIHRRLKEAPTGADYPEPVFATFQEAIETCEKQAPGAKAILSLAVFFAPDDIATAFYQGPEELYPPELKSLLGDDDARLEALSALVSLSLIQLSEEGHSFSLHRLVQAAAKDALGDDHAQWGASAAKVLNAVFPDSDELDNWPLCEAHIPHVQHLFDREVGDGLESPISTLFNNVGYYLRQRAAYKEAEPLYRRALEIDEASFGEHHPKVAIRLNNLAGLLQATNRLDEAEPLIRRALEIDEASLGEHHPKAAIRLNNLAQLLKATNRLDEAEPLLLRVIEILEENDPEKQPNYAGALNNLASLLQATNRLDEAEPLMRRALEIDEASLGEHHPKVATALNNLASLLQATNRLDEAEPLYRRALEIDEASFGEHHPDVATDLNNLALLLKATNRMEEAEPLMRRALEIDEASLGEHHPKVATRLNNLASLLQDTSRLDEAEPLYRRALEIDEASFGEHHPDVGTDLNNLAQLLQATNRLDEAEPLLLRVIEILEKNDPEKQPNYAGALNNLASLLKATNRLDEAEPLYRRALEIDEASLGEHHPDVAIRLNNLASLLKATNRLDEAEPLYRRALEILVASLPAGHPSIETVRGNLMQLLQLRDGG